MPRSKWIFVGDDDQDIETWRKGKLTVQVDRRTAGLPPLCQIPASEIATTPLAGPPKGPPRARAQGLPRAHLCRTWCRQARGKGK